MKAFLEVVWLILKLTYYYFEALVLLFTKPKKKDVSGRTVLITGRPMVFNSHTKFCLKTYDCNRSVTVNGT